MGTSLPNCQREEGGQPARSRALLVLDRASLDRLSVGGMTR